MAQLVDSWKRTARQSMQRERPSRAGGGGYSHVRVTYGFVLLASAIGLRFGAAGPFFTLALLLSVLLTHELPRALLARALGRSAEVQISALGGRTRISGARLHGAAMLGAEIIGSQLNLIMAACGVLILRSGVLPEASAWIELWIESHAVWAIATVVPLLPFRAGHVLMARATKSVRFAHAALSGALLVACATLVASRHLPLVLFPVAVVAAFAALAETLRAFTASRDERSGAIRIAAHASARLRGGDVTGAAESAKQGLAFATSECTRTELRRTLAWAAIAERDALLAHATLATMPVAEIDYHLVAAYLSCCNRVGEAVQLLCEARGLGHRDPETTKLLIDLLYRSGDEQGALAVAHADDTLLSASDRRVIAEAFPASMRQRQ